MVRYFFLREAYKLYCNTFMKWIKSVFDGHRTQDILVTVDMFFPLPELLQLNGRCQEK